MKNPLPDWDDSNNFMVGIGVRVVPAGIVANEANRKFVRAALILSPIAHDTVAETCGKKIDIRQWPERIEQILQNADTNDSTEIKLEFSPVKSGEYPTPSGGGTILHAFRAMPYRPKDPLKIKEWQDGPREEDIQRIGNLWRTLVASDSDPRGNKENWAAIIRALKQADAKSQLKGLRPKGDDETPPDIRGVGRGHAALLLSLERGRSLLARVKLNVEKRPCDDRESECDLASPIATLRSYLEPKDRDELLKQGPKKLKDGEKAARNAFEQLAPEAQRQQIERLEELERKAVEEYQWATPEGRKKIDQAREQPRRKERTETAQARQSSVGALKAIIRGKVSGAVRARAYTALLKCATSDSVSECFIAAAADSTEQLAEAIDGSVDRHNDATGSDDILGTEEKPDLEKQYEITKEQRAAQTRLAGLQHQPSLARLFNLVVDVLIPFDTFKVEAEKADGIRERRGVDGTSRFGFLTAAFATCMPKMRVWTVCKARLRDKDGAKHDDMWACTQPEADLFAMLSDKENIAVRDDLIADGVLSQIDGVMNLAASRKVDGLYEPRFDIISLDAAQAVENRQTSRTTAKLGGPPVITLRTAGLALVDRWRETSALVQAFRSLSRLDDTVDKQVIDAEDLTIGFRMDVAFNKADQAKKGAYQLEWRSLCNRWVTYGDDFDKVEELLRKMIPYEDRLNFDSAITVMPAKIQQTEGGQAVAYVEDIVGQWMGPPIGVDANSLDINLDCPENRFALQLSATSSLTPPSPGQLTDELKIPRLLFGGGYFFGLTPRLHGGIIRPLDNDCYAPLAGSAAEGVSDAEKHFAILPSPTAGPRRFLRHERMEAPIVTTPLPILERVFDKVVDGLRQTANTIVIRSKEDEKEKAKSKDKDKRKDKKEEGTNAYVPFDHQQDKDKKEITSSLRVVFPPSVSAEFADRHGVFAKNVAVTTYADPLKGDWQGPFGGLMDVDYDEESGGFPVYGYSATSQGRIETAPNQLTKPTGDAVFRPRSKDAKRREPYYPDPAACYVVIAVRDLAGRMLKGEPLVVPVRNGAYPAIRPIAIDVVAAKARRAVHPPSQELVLGLQVANGKFLRGADVLRAANKVEPEPFHIAAKDKQHGEQTVAATRVRVLLEPGDSFEIDLWCLPADAKELVKWFDAVESAALVASVDPETGKGCTTCLGFQDRLKALGLNKLSDFTRRLGLSRSAGDAEMCSGGGKTLPRGALLCMGDAAHELLRSRPTPELAARTTIMATHAIPQPAEKPIVDLSVSRVPVKSTSELAEDPKQTVVIGGKVTVDRPTTGFIEIMGEAVSLVSNAFDDDQRRKRTADEVARGIWPQSPITNNFMTVQDVYGFKVHRGNKVELIAEQATLLRIDDDIARPDAPRQEPRELRSLQAHTGDVAKNGNVVRVAAPFTISDSRARVLKIWAVAGSRTAGYFRDDKGDIQPGAIANTKCEHRQLVIQATKEPAKVVPLTILPAFKFEPHPTLQMTVERKVRLRIRMQRPWFSSGEGERLGIILWPPDILKRRVISSKAKANPKADAKLLETADIARRDYEVGGSHESAEIAMNGFGDDDLGPGGGFVSRWGLDPIKGGGKLGWLIPPTAFPDFTQAVCDPGTGQDILCDDDPVYVPRASVPIPIDDGHGGKTRTTLEASLLTFVPRFDVDHETWYCDVEISSSLAPEPFMRLGLVRYQTYAPAHLRVSEPVVEWLQVPQHRSVAIILDKDKPKRVTVNVTGNGALFSATGQGVERKRIESWTQQSVMKISILRKRSDGVEEVAQLDKTSVASGYSTRAERAWLPRTQKAWENALAIWDATKNAPLRDQCAVQPVQLEGTQLSWCCDFDLNENPAEPTLEETRFSVLVEEVQPMLPATYADEPIGDGRVAPEDREELTWSGPRFAALVAIEVKSKPPKQLPPVRPAAPPRRRRAKSPANPPPPAYMAPQSGGDFQ